MRQSVRQSVRQAVRQDVKQESVIIAASDHCSQRSQCGQCSQCSQCRMKQEPVIIAAVIIAAVIMQKILNKNERVTVYLLPNSLRSAAGVRACRSLLLGNVEGGDERLLTL